jgi:hypothetical protein
MPYATAKPLQVLERSRELLKKSEPEGDWYYPSPQGDDETTKCLVKALPPPCAAGRSVGGQSGFLLPYNMCYNRRDERTFQAPINAWRLRFSQQ